MGIANRWLVVFLILPHLNLYFLNSIVPKSIYMVWSFMVVIIALLTITKVSKFDILLHLYMITILISTAINGILTIGVVYTIAVFLGFCVYISKALAKNCYELISGLYYLFATVIVINFATMLTGGIGTALNGDLLYFIGGKNSIALTAIPTIPIVYLYSYFNYKKLKLIPMVLILMSVISIFLSASGTGMVVALLTTIFIFISKKLSPSFFTYFVIYLVSFFTIVIFRFQEALFGNFIVNVLHKDLTFTGRTFIWDVAISQIKQSWFFGYGWGNKVISMYFANLTESHDGILDVLMFCGAFGCLFFLFILIMAGKKLVAHKNNILSKILSFSMFAYLIISLTESVFFKMEFWILIVLSCGVGIIIKQYEGAK